MRKRTQDQAGLVVQQPPAQLVRAASVLLIEKRHLELPAGAELKLQPLIAVTDDRISKIAISGRTPSPFGKMMGDHTVSWQVLVDSVHARLYGLSLDQAIVKLAGMHTAVSSWMGVRNSRGMLLLKEPGNDIADRRPRLEDAACRTSEALGDARTRLGTSADEATQFLALAVAWHLAYLNYLPFATVRARSERGSHGSAEGRHRKVLVDRELGRRAQLLAERERQRTAKVDTDAEKQTEKARQEEVKRLAELDRQAQAAALTTALWALFDFTAAMREAHIEYVLDDQAGNALAAVVTRLEGFRKKITGANQAVQTSGTGMLSSAQQADLADIVRDAGAIASGESYTEVLRAARLVRDAAKAMLETVTDSARSRKSRCDRAATDPALDPGFRDASATVNTIKDRVGVASIRASQVLSSLLHKHMLAVANAYPMSVTDSKLLEPTPAEAAWARLAQAMRDSPEFGRLVGGAGTRLTSLERGFVADYSQRGAITVAVSNDWVLDAGTEPLVVTCDPTAANGRKFTINGRAESPPGVSGMGSHSTAWVLECQALNALANDLTDDTAIRQVLDDAVAYDLTLPVVELDALLPADNHEGGHPLLMFEAAASVLDATTASDAGQAFLRFRNLLPFATVDAGNRAGRGEDALANKEGMYDKPSLAAAAGLVVDSLKSDTERAHLATALKAAAKQLRAEAERAASEDDEDEDESAPVWPANVKKAALRSVKRLNDRSGKLAKWTCVATPTTGSVVNADAERTAKTIKGIRWAEHERTWNLVHPPGS
jgi:hypothetical protein